jgi:hypothetical protein
MKAAFTSPTAFQYLVLFPFIFSAHTIGQFCLSFAYIMLTDALICLFNFKFPALTPGFLPLVVRFPSTFTSLYFILISYLSLVF